MSKRNITKEKFGSRLGDLRRDAGLTQRGFAAEMGVTPQAVYNWEKGLNYPDVETLFKLAVHLKTSIDSLLDIRRQEVSRKEALAVLLEGCSCPKMKHLAELLLRKDPCCLECQQSKVR